METKCPCHIGIVMDGNRRYAKKQGIEPWKGHEKGREALKEIIRYFANLDSETKYLSLYAFSLENLKNRPELEKKFLYQQLKKGFDELLEEKVIFENEVNISTIGHIEMLPDKNLKNSITKIVDATKNYSNKYIVFAICYDGQDEFVNATKRIAEQKIKPEDINTRTIKKNLFTKDIPPLDLLIRTGGEQRLSGFLLWDASYAELYFTGTLFPEFSPADLETAIEDYKSRQRRFGK